MITSWALRFSDRSDDRKLVLASCWVSVLPPWRTPPACIGDHRPADRARVDSPMAAEPPVLDGDEGCRRHRIELARLDRLILDRPAPRDGSPSSDNSSIAGSSSGSSARLSGAVTINHSR